ncbi:MAG TPA: hypothetical protein VND80_07690 [Steroidobacteraceae bacterium]|nr:hypothetical protein [Steroidobacteraceae bacterium]
MQTPADQRLHELLEKWLGSLDLHLKYASLDDDSYRKVQPWVEHQRPTRWIVELAKQKVLALQAQLAERVAAGDEHFSDVIELTIFLANLVGSQHIERFIPLAEAANERGSSSSVGPVAAAGGAAAPPAVDSSTVTREMPKYLASPPRAAQPAEEAAVARVERKAATPAKPRQKAHPAPQRDADPGADAAARLQVLADAQRLIQWGRKWYELPELISRMADRPPLPEVRRILKDNKALVDRKIRGG